VNNEERFEQIERYLRGELAPAEHADFTRQLETDAALKQEVALHRGVESLARREAFLQTLSVTASEHFASEGVQSGGKQRFLYWRVAAAVLLLAAIGIFVLRQPAKPTAQELYAAYFTPYEIPTALRSAGAIHTDADAQQAFTLYSERHYAEAIPLFTKVLERSSDKHTLMVFARGVCYLASGETHRAAWDFQKVIGDDDSLFVDQARWYLALTHLQAGDIQSAQAVLRTVEGAQAKALLREIE